MTFNARIKAIRKLLGLSQEQMADKINYGRSLYTLVEIGKRKPSAIFIQSLRKNLDAALLPLSGEEDVGFK